MSNSHKFTTTDGRTVTIRPIRADADTDLLIDLWHHLSDRTKRLRFHALPREMPEDELHAFAEKLTHIDDKKEAALLATIPSADGETAIGVARLSRSVVDDAVAEAAIVVRDDFQKAGLGTHLLQSLDTVSHNLGIERYEAWVLAENKLMLDIIQKFGYNTEMETSRGETHVVLRLPDKK